MKKVIVFLTALFFLFFCGINVCAETLNNSVADELNIDTNEIGDALPPEVSEYIDEHNLTVDDTEMMTAITPKEVFEYIWQTFTDKLSYPLKVLASLICIIVISAVINGMGDSVCNKSLEKIYGMICVLIAVGIIVAPISSCIDLVADTLYSGSDFMIGYVPVFAGITASAGGITSAVAYNTVVLLVAEAAVQIAANYIMPAMSICMALGIIEAVNPSFNLTSLTEAITKAVKFILGFIMTVFIGLLSLQSIIGASADTIGVKAAKYLASNCIPVVGSAVADAYTTLKASLGILRGGVGFFGVTAIFLTVMPSIAEILIMRFVFTAAEIAGDIFGVKHIKTLLKNSSNILSLMFSLLICFSMMLIISTAILMMIGLDIA